MQSFVYLFLFAFLNLCHAITSPDIYSFTQPDVSTPGLGDASLAPVVPSQSRHGSGPASGLNIFLPNYKSDPNWLPLVLSLKTIGLQVRASETLTIGPQCRTLLVYTSPNVAYTPSTADVTTLTNFVKTGGRLIFMSQVPTALQTLAGVSASTVNKAGKRSILQLSKTNPDPEAFRGFDFNNYYDFSMPFFNNGTSTGGLTTVGYTLRTGATALANYLVRNNQVDASDTSTTKAGFVRNKPTGSTGVVYSFGVDLGSLYITTQAENGDYSEHYDGYYYPGYDIGTRLIKNIVTSSPHYVSLWTVPNNKGIAFTTTWDIDTYVSYPHGQGMAAACLERGAAGNLNLHTKYITDAYERAYFQYGVPYIYQITGHRTASDGYPFIDFGSHSVSHSPNAVQFPSGNAAERYLQGGTAGYSPFVHQCDPNTADGKPTNGQTCIEGGTSGLSFWTSGGSASGEVRISGYLIRHVMNDLFGTNYNLTTYRPGNLAWNKYQGNHCVANGFIGGSSCSGNSHLTHLPFQVTHNRESFQEIPYYEFPLQWSDGDGNMSSADFPGSDFRKQVNDIKNMARYGGHYNILLHPSDAVLDKIQIQRALHDAVRPFAAYFNQTGLANWWTIRDRAVVDITATTATSATMTVRLDGPVEGLTLQVPKTYTFQSATAPLRVCQQVSYDTFTNAVVLRSTAKGVYTLNFAVGTAASTVSNCPDFTVQPLAECVAWDVAVDDFLEDYFFNNGINLLLLKTTSTGLTTARNNGRLQITANANTNSYDSVVSRFCFDATVYTHVYFDTVIPKGSTYQVQLVSTDAGCNNQRTSTTFLNINDYAPSDGQNHTVTIPLKDFVGENFSSVQSVRLVNISPLQVPIYIDNIKIQKRCVTAPGEDRTKGLAIESFQNVDRWITGINNIFGKTDDDGTMKFAKLAELGKMQLLPANAASYIYTSTVVNGAKLNTKGYTDLSINVRGPAGGSFDVVVTSGGSDTTATVNTKSYATLGQNTYSNITIPLTAFAGLDNTAVSRVTLRNFTPVGAAPAGVFTVRWVSLLGGTGTTQPTCSAPAGLAVLNFCDVNEFNTKTSALGTPISDDNTMTTFAQTQAGYVDLVPKDANSYFYANLAAASNCATVNSSYNAISVTVSGPDGATANVGFKHGGTACNTGVVTESVPITFTAAAQTVTIPFSRFPTGFNQNYLQTLRFSGFSAPGSTFRIYNAAFTGAGSTKGCALCEGTAVDTCTFATTPPRLISLNGLQTDEGTLAAYTVATDGSLALRSKQDAYWYSQFGSNSCYNADTVGATGLQLSVAADAGTTFSVTLRWKTDAGCTTLSGGVTVPIAKYVTFSGASNYQVAKIPFSDFPGLVSSRLDSVAIQGFNPVTATVNVGCISLTSVTGSTNPPPTNPPPTNPPPTNPPPTNPPPTNPPPTTQPTCACPANAWLNYCGGSGAANRNANGGTNSDDNTMRVPPALNNNALDLQPAASGSYWYSLLNNVDVSASGNIVLNVTAKAGTTFNLQLQSSGQRSSLPSSTYGTMTGKPVTLTIPLSAYTTQNTALNLKAISAVVLEMFSDSTATYSIGCSYFGAASGTASAAVPRNNAPRAIVNLTPRLGRRGNNATEPLKTDIAILALWKPTFVWHKKGDIKAHEEDQNSANHAVLFTNGTSQAQPAPSSSASAVSLSSTSSIQAVQSTSSIQVVQSTLSTVPVKPVEATPSAAPPA